MVERKQIARRAAVHYEPESIDVTVFSIVVGLKAGNRVVHEVKRTVMSELQALGSELLVDSVLAHAKADLKAKVAFSEEPMSPAARLVDEALVRGRSIKELADWPRRIDSVTADEVRSAAQKLLGRSAADEATAPTSTVVVEAGFTDSS